MLDYSLNQAVPSRFDGGSNAIGSIATEGYAATAAPRPDDDYIIDQLFTYHPASRFTQPKFETIREAAKYFAKVLLNNVPAGADRTAAIQKLREAVMTANAGISLGGLSL